MTASNQARADAFADAATLRVVADVMADHDDAAYAVWTLLCEAGGYRTDLRRSAHAAFLAVPGLRG